MLSLNEVQKLMGQTMPTLPRPIGPSKPTGNKVPLKKDPGDSQTPVKQEPTLLPNQGQPSPDQSDDDPNLGMEDTIPPSPEEVMIAELLPVKKYYVIQRLLNLKAKVVAYSIECDALDILIKFADALSYDTLLTLSEKALDDVDRRFKEVIKQRPKDDTVIKG